MFLVGKPGSARVQGKTEPDRALVPTASTEVKLYIVV